MTICPFIREVTTALHYIVDQSEGSGDLTCDLTVLSRYGILPRDFQTKSDFRAYANLGIVDMWRVAFKVLVWSKFKIEKR